jgi:hypothetical protein
VLTAALNGMSFSMVVGMAEPQASAGGTHDDATAI